MKNLYNFDEYVNECYTESIKGTIQSIAFDGIFESSYLKPAEKLFLKNIINENSISSEILDESFIDTIRQSIKSAKEKGFEVAKKVGDEVMSKLEKLAQSAKDFAAYIIDKIKQLWGWAANKYSETKDKQKQAIKDALLKNKDKIISHKEDLKKGLSTDMSHLKETLGWWKKEFIGIFMDKMKDSLSKILVKESLTWKGEAILEFVSFDFNSINENEAKFGWLSKIVHALAKVPPFSMLAAVREKLTASFGSFLQSISDVTKNMGGPGVYEFAAITILLGALAEYAVKKLAVGAAMNVIPFAGTLVHVLGYIALGALFVEVIEELLKTGELTGEKPGALSKEKQGPSMEVTKPTEVKSAS